MTTPTIEQIDAAIKSAPKKSGDFMLDAGQAHYFFYHHLNEIVFALRFLRLALQEPSVDVGHAGSDAYSNINHSGQTILNENPTIKIFKDMIGQMMAEVEK